MKRKKEVSTAKRSSQSNSTALSISLNIAIAALVLIVLFIGYKIYQNAVSPVEEDALARIDTTKASKIIQVEVLNGSGIPKIADSVTQYLRNEGFDVVQTGNYINFDVENSFIIDRTGNKANALKLASVYDINEKFIVQQRNSDYLLDVSFIIGKDYNKIKK